MLKDWSVSNFKAIATTRVVNEDGNINDKIDFKPLTVLCGANSSGKSSLLQSLLLIAQTMRHQNEDIPLILNGAFTSLGTFDDIKTKLSNCDEVKIRFTYEPLKERKFFNNKYPFNGSSSELKNVESIKNNSFLLDFSQGKNKISPELSNFELSINFIEHTLKYYAKKRNKKLNKNFYSTDSKMTEINQNFPDEECRWNHILPENIKINGKHILTMSILSGFSLLKLFPSNSDLNLPPVIYPDRMTELAEYFDYNFYYYSGIITKGVFFYLKDNLLSDIQSIDILFDLKDFKFEHDTQGYSISKLLSNFEALPVSIRNEVIDRINNNLHIIYNKIFDDLSKIQELMSNNTFQETYESFDDAKLCCDLFFDDFVVSDNIENYLSEISYFFSSEIFYLGPLREDPKPLYPISESSYIYDIGRKGENTAAILALYGEDIRNFLTPDCVNEEIYNKENITLKEAVVKWLIYIGVVENIEAEIKQGGFTLKVFTSGSKDPSDLTNVGVGVSQVIPIVTMCLAANKGSTLIIEQPELHLHPKMQTKLTDFFVAISQSGKQCIIETHSEHIINALRYRVAKTASPDDEKLANDVQIYFVKKDENGTLFESITMDKYAYISEWPEDFFDEAQVTNINTLKAINKKLEEDPPSE
jgi:predicted ATPase